MTMENAYETEVAAPTAPTGTTTRPANAVVESVATPSYWYWCSTCKLAASKAGACHGCGTPYALAPEVGVPDTPYNPRIPAERTVRGVVGSAVAMVLVIVAAIGAIVVLASHGSATDSTSSASGGGISNGAHVDGLSTYGIAPLHGTLRLQGTWGTSVQQFSLNPPITAGATVKSQLSVGKGGDTIAMGSFPSADPTGVLNQVVSATPQTSDGGMGQKVTAQPTRDLTIAGYTAVAQDMETRTTKGGLVNRGTLYLVNAGDQVVVIRTSVVAAQAGDLPGLEQALVAIG